MIDRKRSSSSAVGAQKRQRPYSPTLWAKIRPSLELYYIDQDRTLAEAIQNIGAEHDFHATEQMYKKRLRAWGLSRQSKADEKEKALAVILGKVPGTYEIAPIRHDKLVRYAKSRIRCGSFDDQALKTLMTRRMVVSGPYNLATVASSVPAVLTPPDQFAEFDVFLRAMQALIQRERQEWLTGQQVAPDAIFSALTRGMFLWRSDDFAAARTCFGGAARMTTDDLQSPQVTVSRIAYRISSILWGAEREPVFLKFSEFMVKAAFEILGAKGPVTIVLRYIQQEPGVDIQLRIWECALNDYEIGPENIQHWWNMAQRRWRWCHLSGKLEIAERYCTRAMAEARRIDELTAKMELDARHDLEAMSLKKSVLLT